MRGVNLSAENMGADRPAFIILTPEEQVDLCQSTGTWITLDLIHLASLIPQGQAFDDALAMLIPYTKELHIADMRGSHHAHLPIGEGDLELRPLLEKIEALGYKGAAIVEEFVREYTPDFYLEKALAFKRAYNV
jgi:sugar phosphate isomerase/epimerase